MQIERVGVRVSGDRAATKVNCAMALDATGLDTTLQDMLAGKPQPACANMFIHRRRAENCAAKAVEGCCNAKH
jgi:hypothetical protein